MTEDILRRLFKLEARVSEIESAIAPPAEAGFGFTRDIDPLEARHFQVAQRVKSALAERDGED